MTYRLAANTRTPGSWLVQRRSVSIIPLLATNWLYLLNVLAVFVSVGSVSLLECRHGTVSLQPTAYPVVWGLLLSSL